MSDNELIGLISSIFEDQLGLPRPDPSADLLADGVLDSLSLLDLLADIEAELGVQMDLTALELTDLRSVCTLAAFVERNR